MSVLSHQELHPASVPALGIQSREAGCYAEERKSAKVHALSMKVHSLSSSAQSLAFMTLSYSSQQPTKPHSECW